MYEATAPTNAGSRFPSAEVINLRESYKHALWTYNQRNNRGTVIFHERYPSGQGPSMKRSIRGTRLAMLPA